MPSASSSTTAKALRQLDGGVDGLPRLLLGEEQFTRFEKHDVTMQDIAAVLNTYGRETGRRDVRDGGIPATGRARPGPRAAEPDATGPLLQLTAPRVRSGPRTGSRHERDEEVPQSHSGDHREARLQREDQPVRPLAAGLREDSPVTDPTGTHSPFSQNAPPLLLRRGEHLQEEEGTPQETSRAQLLKTFQEPLEENQEDDCGEDGECSGHHGPQHGGRIEHVSCERHAGSRRSIDECETAESGDWTRPAWALKNQAHDDDPQQKSWRTQGEKRTALLTRRPEAVTAVPAFTDASEELGKHGGTPIQEKKSNYGHGMPCRQTHARGLLLHACTDWSTHAADDTRRAKSVATPENQINQLRKDFEEADSRLRIEIQKKLDKDKLSFLETEDKTKKEAEKKEEEKKQGTYEASLQKYIEKIVEKASKSTWKPDTREFKTPEFMGLVTALTLGAVGGTLMSIGLTIVKYDMTILDMTERVNRFGLKLINHLTKRTEHDRQFLTEQQKAERKLHKRFADIEHRLARRTRNANTRLGALERRTALIERSRNQARERVGAVSGSPGNIPSTHSTANELNFLHRRINELVSAIG
ncbi:hypothetical protein M4914_15310 [Streptomyces somaliensis DSM 40738]|uniref:Uncharacterized protein n=1 Tax=Streptomyces somaliensis (strain ATCC 33201 / DSM 40738 / JCM 12659 / KCTC 9044 / NCTC 11332 / NRRL B-12077 / IP 733) TaxID=1134445 RepID=A0AA44IDW9_STRE0|nr:hypothetical protein [Streptomyces somaliensis]MCQ0024188.1 hypothetical protein [Streptomyces somaliensis DSM 40738]NKY15160.1 hypothetical protein [Streptomyces somaliensis DSM 40738]